MSIRFYKLFDLLNRRDILKTELQKDLKLSPSTMAKLSANKPVSLEIINRLCEYLDCQPGDLMEYHKNKKL